MAMNLSDKSIPTFQSGMDVEEKSFLWKIPNFQDVIGSDSMIDWQAINFHMGDKISLPSDWTMNLTYKTKSGDRWMGIFYKMKEKPPTSCTELLTQCHVAIKNKDGTTFWESNMSVKDAFTLKRNGWGVSKMIKDYSTLPFLIDGSLVIHVKFKIYSKLKLNTNPPIEEVINEFHTKARAKAWSDVQGFLKNPSPCNELTKLVSCGGEEFSVHKAVLTARNPVFKAILESNMAEGNSGVVQLPNISSPTLKVLVHFLCQGELPPDWSHPEVIVELTNAAAQYQIDDLLQFLDSMLGRVCTLENVAELLALTDRLSLNTANEDLMQYVRHNGSNSQEHFFEILESVRVGDSSGGSSSKKRRQADGDNENGTAGKKPKKTDK